MPQKSADHIDQQVVIRLENVSKTFTIRDRDEQTIRGRLASLLSPSSKRKIEALKNVNLEVKRGEFIGIIGRNGSGKSTLLHLMTGAYPPDRGGKSSIHGRYMRLSLGLGFNKELTARQNIYINASIMGLTFREIDRKFDEIIDFAELQEFKDSKIKYFSKGMRSRLSFAIALHAEADIFLMDEFFGGVGDERFKRKAEAVFDRSFIEGRTIVHVSHSLATIRKYCHRVVLMEKGAVAAIGKPDEVIAVYKQLVKTRH